MCERTTGPALSNLSRTGQHIPRGGVWRCAVLSWDAQLEAAKKEIAELENRIAALREELQAAQWAADAARAQRMLTVREEHLERAKFHAQFIEHKIAQGC